ncbi:hypothetical protein RISK_006179 [Rhodopirellula islandica]|uniref:Uncharacterized protein n=1 Tax=Rhodopirellula islandica TaxID=595434 RepID=A0A0J1B493_RHOIS|nr:hypothetical protein RISK_006179 [Rhodopirellula islandica]
MAIALVFSTTSESGPTGAGRLSGGLVSRRGVVLCVDG